MKRSLKIAVSCLAWCSASAWAQSWEGDFQHGIAWFDASAEQIEALADGVETSTEGLSFNNQLNQPAPHCVVATTPYAFGSEQTQNGRIGFVVEYDSNWYGTEFAYNTTSLFDVNLEFQSSGQTVRKGKPVPLKVHGMHEDRGNVNGLTHVSAIGSKLVASGNLAAFAGEASEIKLKICWIAPWATVTIRRIGLSLSE